MSKESRLKFLFVPWTRTSGSDLILKEERCTLCNVIMALLGLELLSRAQTRSKC
jgi:hypothetical protein